MRCINEQLTKANDCLRFAADDLRGALADANAVQALVLLPLIADTTRLAQQIIALIEAMGACESEAQHKLDWDLVGEVMAKHGIPGDIAPLESESGFIARLLDEACSRSSWTQHASDEVDGLLSIEMKRHVLHLDDLEEAVSFYADDIEPGQGGVLQGNLRIGSDDINAQKKNLEVLAAVERLLELVTELGGTAAYLSQAEMVLPGEHAWVKQAQTARTDILAKLSADRTVQHANEYRQTLGQLKKDYVTAYIACHSKARLGVAEDKTKTALRKDLRLVAIRALAGISLMPTSQLTVFEEKLDNLKSCYQLSDSELVASPYCPHCSYKPANESLPFGVAANALTQLDDELDRMLAGWQQTLLDNLDDPITQANLDLLKAAPRKLIQSFVASKALPDPVTPDFVSAVQEALSGLEKIAITSDDIKNALLHGGSPATPDDLRKRFETFLNERCKGKDATKLRFVVE